MININIVSFYNSFSLSLFPKWNLSVFDKRERVPLIEVFEKAEKLGWDFRSTDSLEILDFGSALVQAGLDGLLQFWGRPDRNMLEQLTKNEPLNKITADTWKDFRIYTYSYFNTGNLGNITGYTLNNFEGYAHNVRDNKDIKFKDIYVTNKNIKKWLKSSQQEFQGKRHSQQD